MFENGVYVRGTEAALVWNDMAVAYSIGYWGDLAAWEISATPDEPVDVSGCPDVPEMMAKAFGWHWTPNIEDVEFIPADEIPFAEDEFPPVSEEHPDRQNNILVDDSPFLAWAYESGIISV